jgi:hypothetical protein
MPLKSQPRKKEKAAKEGLPEIIPLCSTGEAHYDANSGETMQNTKHI